MDELTVSEARARLPEILDRIERGEEITITRHGRRAAVMLRPDSVRVRRGESAIDRAREIGRMLEEARKQPLGPADGPTAELAATLAATHRLRAADAFHLATAVLVGADRFLTDNRRDFGSSITEIEVVYPDARDDA